MKVFFRETIIALLICLAVLLVLSVALYNYIPSNKIIPEVVQYSPSQEIQAQLNASNNNDEIVMTYEYKSEVTAQDINNYEKTNNYNPGKANPFAPISEEITPDADGNSESNPSTGTTIPSGGNSSTGNSGSLFENSSSK